MKQDGSAEVERRYALIAGKLNGQIAPVTPRGNLILVVSMSLATSTLSPFIKVGIAVMVSTTCRPRNTSPMASACVLPCSRVMLAAISDWYWRMRAWYLLSVSDGFHTYRSGRVQTHLSMMFCRENKLVFFHVFHASADVSMACFISSGVV